MDLEMRCLVCKRFDAAERAAIEGRPMPSHSIEPAACTCAEREIAFTYLSPAAFHNKAGQVGITIRQERESFFRWLSSPTATVVQDPNVAKRVAGAWCPAALENGIVKDGTGPFGLLPIDIDKCGPDGFDRSCEAFASYSGVIVTTCSAEPEDMRHRVVLDLSRLVTADEHRPIWRKLQRTLLAAGIPIDATCKNINRLYFAPVVRAGHIFCVHGLTGAAVDVDRMLAVAREEEARAKANVSTGNPNLRGRGDAPIDIAFRCAADSVARAPEGARNDTLVKEAYALARFDIRDSEIENALLPAAQSAGLSEREAIKTITSGIRGRRKGAA